MPARSPVAATSAGNADDRIGTSWFIRLPLSQRRFRPTDASRVATHEGGDLTVAAQSDCRHAGTQRKSGRLDAGPGNLLKIPNENQQLPVEVLWAAFRKVGAGAAESVVLHKCAIARGGPRGRICCF